MRVIKIRAWDGRVMHNLVWAWKAPYFEFTNEFHGEWMYGINASNIILMQFTGLRDKNGVEIYEGDILCLPKYEGTEHQTRWPVEWDGERAQFTYWSPRKDAEVIGNIYSNPELLK